MPAAPKTSSVVSIRVVNFKTIFKFLARFSMITLGKSKVNCSWHVFTSYRFSIPAPSKKG